MTMSIGSVPINNEDKTWFTTTTVPQSKHRNRSCTCNKGDL